MPRITRGQTGGVCSHVINRGNARQAVFHDDQDYAGFVELIGQACGRVAMRVVGCCLMPNHMHLVVWPADDGDLSRWMQWLMTSHVRRHHRRYGSSGHVWQGRFKSFLIQRRSPGIAERAVGVLEHGDPVLDVLRYVERNPLRSGLVGAAEEWRWSSLRWWADAATAPAWWKRDVVWRPADWLERVNQPQNERELAAMRRCVARGCPYGSESWVRRMVSACGLESTVRPRGRPRKDQEK
jgi:putative transposase